MLRKCYGSFLVFDSRRWIFVKRYLRIAKITSVVVVASLISSPIIAYAGSSGYVGEVSNVFNDDTDSGEGFTWSYSDSILTLTDNVNGNVVADNDITITTSDNPVTVSGNIEVSTADPSTNADLTIDNANITTSGSISADGDVKIISVLMHLLRNRQSLTRKRKSYLASIQQGLFVLCGILPEYGHRR